MKIVIIGVGMVGASFIYSLIENKIGKEYVLIDVDNDYLLGQKLDFEDAICISNSKSKIKIGNYQDCSNADIVVICAGRRQKEGESRLNMIQDNFYIIKDIAIKIKKSGFCGISIIASNPVDCMTYFYQKETGFDPNKVISSGCFLDSIRFQIELGNYFNIPVSKIKGFVIGEHGDSSVPIFSNIFIKNKIFTGNIDEKIKKEIISKVHNKAYDIIQRKKATYYGIGSVLCFLCKIIYKDLKTVVPIGKLLNGEYGEYGVYATIPCILGKNGIENVKIYDLTEKELKLFAFSVKNIKNAIEKIN